LQLENEGDVDVNDVSKDIDDETLYLINQLGVIYISVNDKISLSPVGRMAIVLLDQYFVHK
jgi:hypothetical protein